MLRQFLLKLILFCLPAGLVSSLPFAVAYYSGEAMSPAEVVTMQMGAHPVIYGTGNDDLVFNYKLAGLRQRQPDLVVIGSSRVVQFRAELATLAADEFYNAGVAGGRFDVLSPMIEQMQPAPTVMLVGLDQVWFNEDETDWNAADWNFRDYDLTAFGARSLDVWQAVIRGRLSLDDLLCRRAPIGGGVALGLDAIMNANGYRSDGSWQSGSSRRDAERAAESREGAIRRIGSGGYFYWANGSVSEDRLGDLAEMLALARSREIEVIGFFSPYMPTIYEAISADGDGFLYRVVAEVEAVFAEYDYPFFDFTDASDIGAEDAAFRDSWHPSEWLSLRMYIEMLRAHPDLLGSYSDLAALEQLAESPYSYFDVWGTGDVPSMAGCG